jgi:methionine-rich copper-binding protein CopC
MFERIARLMAAAGLLAGGLIGFASTAEAHASLVSCNGLPRNGVVKSVPKVLTCTFAEGVNPKGSFIRIVEATGDGGEDDLGNSQVSFANAHQMTVGVPKLAPGKYYLMWFTISADDGHKAGGVLPFTVK